MTHDEATPPPALEPGQRAYEAAWQSGCTVLLLEKAWDDMTPHQRAEAFMIWGPVEHALRPLTTPALSSHPLQATPVVSHESGSVTGKAEDVGHRLDKLADEVVIASATGNPDLFAAKAQTLIGVAREAAAIIKDLAGWKIIGSSAAKELESERAHSRKLADLLDAAIAKPAPPAPDKAEDVERLIRDGEAIHAYMREHAADDGLTEEEVDLGTFASEAAAALRRMAVDVGRLAEEKHALSLQIHFQSGIMARSNVMEARATAAEAALTHFQDEVWGAFQTWSMALGWGITGMQPECYAMMDASIDRMLSAEVERDKLKEVLEAIQPSLTDVAAKRLVHAALAQEGTTP